MIKRETVLSMQCDNCGVFITDTDGYIISLPDDDRCMNLLTRIAKKSGWRKRKELWTCPNCLEEGAK